MVISNSSVVRIQINGLEHIDVLTGIELRHRVVLRKPSIVIPSISDFELLGFPPSDSFIEVSPALVNPSCLVELSVND